MSSDHDSKTPPPVSGATSPAESGSAGRSVRDPSRLRLSKALNRGARLLGVPTRASRGFAPGIRYACEPMMMLPRHRLEVLIDGAQAFPAMLEAIGRAKTRVWLESYIFESDVTGRRFINALCEQASAGLDVRLLVDAFGGMDLSEEDQLQLLTAGVKLAFFGRFNNLEIGRWLRRDHRKILVIDHELAFVGGINISDDYAPEGKAWHDIQVSVRGNAVEHLATLFATTWTSQADALDPDSQLKLGPQEGSGTEWCMVLGSDHRGNRFVIRRHLLHALRQAKESIQIASAYFVPDRGILRALCRAAQRGVQVSLLMPAHSDVLSAQWAGEHSYGRLLKSGVRIYLWQGSHMHAKALVVDRQWCMLGSYNLDYVSLLMNLEVVLEIAGAQTPETLALQLSDDCERSEEIQSDSWQERAWYQKFRSRTAHRFRRWL